MSEQNSPSFLDNKLSRRQLLKLGGALAVSTTIAAIEAAINPAVAQTPDNQEPVPETLDDLISKDPAILGTLNFTEAAKAGEKATISSESLPLNYPDMPVATSISFDNKFRKPEYKGASVGRSAKTGAEIMAIHSSTLEGGIPLPGEGMRTATEGHYKNGYLGPTQIAVRMRDIINSTGTFTINLAGAEENLKPTGVKLYPPGKDGRPLLEGDLLNYLFKDGDENTLKMMFCGTIAPFAMRELSDKIKDTTDPGLKAAREILLSGKATDAMIRSTLADVIYPILYKTDPDYAQNMLVRSTRYIRETGDISEPLRFVNKEEMEKRFGLPLEKFFGSTYVWTFELGKK